MLARFQPMQATGREAGAERYHVWPIRTSVRGRHARNGGNNAGVATGEVCLRSHCGPPTLKDINLDP